MRRRAYMLLLLAQWLLLIDATILLAVGAWTDAVICVVIGYAAAIAIPIVKPKPLTLDEEIELEQAIAAHPAGKQRGGA